MTQESSTPEGAATVASPSPDDPHAPKIALDDPRFGLQSPSRVLKLKPILVSIALLAGVAGAVTFWGVRNSDTPLRVTQEPSKAAARPEVVPAFLQEVPDTPAPPRLPPAVDAKPLPPPSERPARYVEAPRPDPRIEQQLAQRAQLDADARSAGIFFDSGSRSTQSMALANAPAATLPLQPSAGMSGAPMLGASSLGDDGDPNLQGRKNAFLDQPKALADYLPTTLQPAFSPYEVKATTIIPATLITGIDSDLPGPIIAQVRERVYDTVTGQHLLIPQGARLLASYDSMVAWGQERVLMCWNRIIMPNGKSINIQCMPAADLKGQAGLTDEVDNHWDRLMAAVGLSTVLSLGAQAVAGDPTGYQQNLAQRSGANAAGQINSAGQAVVQRQINLQPTITVRPGFGVNVIVTKDMVLEPYVD